MIPNGKITSSSVYLQYYSYEGRLNGAKGWCPYTTYNRNDFIQVDIGAARSICAVATQGKKNGSYVTSYKLLLSSDGVNWTTYQEQNVDKVKLQTYTVPSAKTRLRFYKCLCFYQNIYQTIWLVKFKGS